MARGIARPRRTSSPRRAPRLRWTCRRVQIFRVPRSRPRRGPRPKSVALPAGPAVPATRAAGAAAGAPGKCVAATGSCAPIEGTCTAGSCGGCGGLGQTCCSSTCTAAGTACVSGVCARCGGVGDPCCARSTNSTAPIDPNTGRTSGVCSAPGLICGGTGRCVTCGNPNEPCCPDNSCGGAGCCFAGLCVGAGATCDQHRRYAEHGRNLRGGPLLLCGGRDQPCCGTGVTPPATNVGRSARAAVAGPAAGRARSAVRRPARDRRAAMATPARPVEHLSKSVEAPASLLPGPSVRAATAAWAAAATPRRFLPPSGTSFGLCQAGRCGCGRVGEPCCPQTNSGSDGRRTEMDSACSGGSFQQAGTCVECGGPARPAAPASAATEAGLACRGGSSSSSGEGVLSRRSAAAPRRALLPRDGHRPLQRHRHRLHGLYPGGPLREVRDCQPRTRGHVPCCGGNQCTDGSCCVTQASTFEAPYCVGANRNACGGGMAGTSAAGSCGGSGAAGRLAARAAIARQRPTCSG